ARLGLARLTCPYLPSDTSPARRNSPPGAGRAGRPNQTNRGRTVMRTNKTRLGVERLDEREVPACIVAHPTPDPVVITGDGANDTVLIRDNGFGGISGGATGAGAFSFAGIKKIQVSTNGGSDRVSYTLFRDLQPGQSRDVFVSLGSSPRGTQDTFVANLYNPVTGVGSDLKAGSTLAITALGGDGRDVMFVNAFKDTDVALGAKLKVNLFGKGGNDIIMTNYLGENDGTVSFLTDGGTGNDLMRSRFTEAPGSTGVLDAVVKGGDGQDNLGLFIFSAKAPAQALLDGGAGIELACFHTPNVTAINCPRPP